MAWIVLLAEHVGKYTPWGCRRLGCYKVASALLQVEGCKLRDYEGNYERFLEKNEGEAEFMAEKEAKKKELEKSQIKSKSKVLLPLPPPCLCRLAKKLPLDICTM